MKNIYFEQFSGNFDSFDYYISADIEDSGVVNISAFIHHNRINFNNMVNDFKVMLRCLKTQFELNDYNFDLSSEESTNHKDKSYEISVNPTDGEITVKIFSADFNQISLAQSFAYSVGYIQSFLLHSEVIPDNEENEDD